MGIIQNLIKSWKEKKEEKKRMENLQKWQEQIDTKKLNANERELMRFKEEQRQERIKAELGKFRKARMNKIWRGKTFNPVYAPNIIKDDKNLFKNNNLFFKKAKI